MKGKLIYARKTASGGRCCSFKHKCTTTNGNKTAPHQRGKEDDHQQQESMMEQLTGTSIKTIRNTNIPSNQQIHANKPKMDAFAKKLENIKLKKRNITFNV